MTAQLRKYAPFYGVMSAGLFGFGWWVDLVSRFLGFKR